MFNKWSEYNTAKCVQVVGITIIQQIKTSIHKTECLEFHTKSDETKMTLYILPLLPSGTLLRRPHNLSDNDRALPCGLYCIFMFYFWSCV